MNSPNLHTGLIPVPPHIQRDDWLMSLLAEYRAGDDWENVVAAGMIDRLGDRTPAETKELIDALFAGTGLPENPARLWARALTEPQVARIKSLLITEIDLWLAGLDLKYPSDPGNPGWRGWVRALLLHRDDIQCVVQILHAAGAVDTCAESLLACLDREGQGWFQGLPWVEGLEGDERIRRAWATLEADGSPPWWAAAYMWDGEF